VPLALQSSYFLISRFGDSACFSRGTLLILTLLSLYFWFRPDITGRLPPGLAHNSPVFWGYFPPCPTLRRFSALPCRRLFLSLYFPSSRCVCCLEPPPLRSPWIFRCARTDQPVSRFPVKPPWIPLFSKSIFLPSLAVITHFRGLHPNPFL